MVIAWKRHIVLCNARISIKLYNVCCCITVGLFETCSKTLSKKNVFQRGTLLRIKFLSKVCQVQRRSDEEPHPRHAPSRVCQLHNDLWRWMTNLIAAATGFASTDRYVARGNFASFETLSLQWTETNVASGHFMRRQFCTIAQKNIFRRTLKQVAFLCPKNWMLFLNSYFFCLNY